MNTMALSTPIARFSAGEISRKELGRLIGQPISFGDTLAMLHAENLPLPNYRRAFNPRAVEMIREAAARHAIAAA